MSKKKMTIYGGIVAAIVAMSFAAPAFADTPAQLRARADRLEINGQGGSDDAIKMTTLMLIKKAENEDGTKAFQLGDLAALRRLPEKILNQMELALFGVDKDGNPVEQLELEVAKKD